VDDVPPPYVVALNLTRRCNLACAHCYLDARLRRDGDARELTLAEVARVLDEIAALSAETMVVLTGGEPLLRRDLEAMAGHAAGLGLMVVVGTNGMALTARRAAALKDAGVQGVGISVDSLDPARHDRFRGLAGAFARTMAGIDACREAGLALQIHFTVTDDTAGELDDMIAFARSLGAIALNVFFVVCTGRGRHLGTVGAAVHDRVLRRLTAAARAEEGLMVRAKCAPHFKRMAVELDPGWAITAARGYDAGGCLAGTRYARVTPDGEVTPCPYMEVSAGSVRRQGFATIWREARLFAALRAPRLRGRCGACEYGAICGGCRARPLALSGDMMGEDPLCLHVPAGAAAAPPVAPPPAPAGPAWSPEALARLAHVPPFVRRMVRERAEAHVLGEGRAEVAVVDLETLMRRRFGAAGPPRPAPARPAP